MTRPTYLQPAATVSTERQGVTRRAANLCRAAPARFAAVVRYADQLQAEGADLDAEVALREALDAYGA